MTYRRIVIAVSPARFMRWHERLRATLARRWPEATVAFRFEPQDSAQPAAVTQLLALESLLLLRGKPALSDIVDAHAAQATLETDADALIDLVGTASPASAQRVLQPRYDGRETDQAAVAAILSGAAPTLSIEDAATGATLAQGLPALESGNGLTGGLDDVYSRMIVLIEKAMAAPENAEALPPAERTPRKPLEFILRNLAFQCARAIYHLCCHSPHWRIGWRFNNGPGVLDGVSLDGAPWRVMQDAGLSFGADPFPIDWRGRTGVFFEAMDYRTQRGAIGFQEFDVAGPVGAPLLALSEPWHLSYPFLIREGDELYMLPEASKSDAVTLYRCIEFPGKWEPVARLLDGVEAADATIFQHGGKYWMTSVVRDGVGGYSDTLSLHHAPSLFGPWEPHAQSPALIDSRFARPAGAVIARDGALLRPAQDCSRGYGKGIAIMRIDRLDEERFEQSLVGCINSGAGWPGDRLHTINRCGRLECIDGAILTPKHLPLRRLVHDYIDARRLARAETSPESAMSLALSKD